MKECTQLFTIENNKPIDSYEKKRISEGTRKKRGRGKHKKKLGVGKIKQGDIVTFQLAAYQVKYKTEK